MLHPYPNVILIGFMGTGKTTVGRALATRLGWLFVDSDHYIEERAGETVSAMFARHGEAYFRAVETSALKEILGGSGQVVATGGGAVLAEENRGIMLSGGLVAALKASPTTIIKRVRGDTSRPLLAGDVEERVYRLLDARKSAYDFASLQLDTDKASVEQLVDELIARLFRVS